MASQAVAISLAAIPALVLAGTMDWEDLAIIDWGTILLFGGGTFLADAFARTGATHWLAESFFQTLVGSPVLFVVGAVVLLTIFLSEIISNPATATVLAPLPVGLGGPLAGSFGLTEPETGALLAIAGGAAASYAFALPIATPPNAIGFGSGYLHQGSMLRAGLIPNLLMTGIRTLLITALFLWGWPGILW